MNTNTEFRNNPGQEGIAIHSHRALLGRLAADGCKSRHGRYDRKRERSYSGLRSIKKSIARAVSRSAARFRRIHVIVRNEGCEPLQWHYNGLHEVSQDEFGRVRWRGSLSVSSSWRSHWVWISADCARSQRRGLCQSRRGGRVLLRRLRERRRRWRRLGRDLRRLLLLLLLLLLVGHRRRRPRRLHGVAASSG